MTRIRIGFVFALIATSIQTSLAALAATSEKSDLDGSDFRRVVPEVKRFSDEDDPQRFGQYTELLFDLPRYQLIVGGRDAIYRLGLDGLTKLEKTVWDAKTSSIGLCTAKGQTEENCRNYVKVLVEHDDMLFACGTNAFSPKCSWRGIEDVSKVIRWVDGRGKCPHSPLANVTAVMTESGDYYVATSTDFSGNDHAIYRMSGPNFGDNVLRTMQYNALWLSEPDFIGTFETDKYMYFVFRETAVEHINCGKAIYSRLARVCKEDKGGTLVHKDNWTTFLKARLNCSLPGEYPFYYDEIRSFSYLPQEGIFYAVFSTGSNAIAGSALCSFNLTAVETAFSGPFKTRASPDSTWKPADGDHSSFECKSTESSKHLGINSRTYQLVDNAVQPTSMWPLYREHLARYTHVSVEAVNTKHQEYSPIHVIFIALESGVIKKLSYNSRTGTTCLIEVLMPFEKTTTPFRNMKLLVETGSLYVATNDSLLQIPTQRCSRFNNIQACLNAMDPYCGWNNVKGACTPTPNGNPRASYFQQNPITCPVLTDPVNGGWSSWSPWFLCHLDSTDGKYIESSSNGDGGEDTCLCRKRSCDNPTPVNGGAPCDGHEISVTNCTQHGRWTPWSEWSACSKSCDIGIRTRRRTCGNPAPAFSGKSCIGQDQETQYCDDLPPCQSLGLPKKGDSQPRVEYSAWSEWSKCSTDCGLGFKKRSRTCLSGGNDACSCTVDYKKCEEKKCTEITRLTEFTPWLRANFTSGGAWHETRYSFTYDALDGLNKGGSILKAEKRLCRDENQCSTTSVFNGPPLDRAGVDSQSWSEWSKCSRECGGGYQIRALECDVTKDYSCKGGITLSERACNTQPCPGEWTCWSEWSECDIHGKRRRSRECRSSLDGSTSSEALCEEGSSSEQVDCDDGWGPWGDWSECKEDSDYSVRIRACLSAGQCFGSNYERQACDETVGVSSKKSASSNSVIVGVVIGFFMGLLSGAGLVYYFFVFRYRRGAVRGSPHYVSAKSQNLYVSLPMLDLKNRPFSSSNQSDCGTLRSTTTAGTLRSKASVSSVFLNTSNGPTTKLAPNDYETATIKRSHSHRNSSILNGGTLRADLDSDQLFT